VSGWLWLFAIAGLFASGAPNDYTDGANWLCRPGRQDACAVDLAATVVAADGKLTREEWKRDPSPPIDCFYVYPTVSADATINSDMTPGPEERRIAASQIARFASACRVYAPLYRQISLAGLRAGVFGRVDGSALLAHTTTSDARALAYGDVRDAWHAYLQRDNHGRGVVLIGHSQGAFLLADLIQQEIDGKAVQSRLVSAMLLGMSLPVPGDQSSDHSSGAFRHLPLCRAPSDTGCVVSYATFRSTSPPPANTLFGHVAGEHMTSACTNPAALGGGSGELRAYLNTGGHPFEAGSPIAWVTPMAAIDTPFVTLPGLLTAQCVSNERGSYLEITVHGDPADPRADDIVGDVKTNGEVNPAWGLHLIDVNLAMGNLVDLVRQQARAYGRKPTRG
jgi:Protein of unknown function (DUF3089)